ncbi:MAG TPA: glycosyltransferase [Pyrinomonadaceae bacterium]|nr:glycosyltransferase [Pyrinomonadaceae bacterium]
MDLISKVTTAVELFRTSGMAAIRGRLATLRHRLLLRRQYVKWMKTKGAIDRAQIVRDIALLPRQPKVSIVMPVYDVDEKWLRKCIDSVCGQIYENWELCIADDASPSPHIRRVLEEYSATDERIKVVFREKNGHISAASNSALELVTGEFVVLLDHDDELSADALYWVARTIVDEPSIAMIYSDEDLIDESGKRSRPAFKPDWSLDLFYSLNLITHLSAYKTDLLQSVGGFRIGIEGSQDYDLALRAIEVIDESQIKHIPRVLYHWRAIPGSVALSGDEKPYAHECARKAIREHFERTGKKATVEPTDLNLHRVSYAHTGKIKKVLMAVIGDGDAFCDRLVDSSYDFEIAKFEREGRLAERLDRAVEDSDCDVVCFVNSEIKSLSSGWLFDLVSFLEDEQIGAVGGKLLDEADIIVDGALYLNADTGVMVADCSLENEIGGNMLRSKVIGNFSAVSLSLMAVRRSDLIEIGGFGGSDIGPNLIDVDICLKLANAGRRIVSVPFVEGIVRSGYRRSRPSDSELSAFKHKWKKELAYDRFYNPNLSTRNGRSEIDV